MQAKFHYDRKHQSIYLDVNDYALLRLHRDYNIFSTKFKKLNQQYVDFFRVVEKIKRLIYRLKISKHWMIHFVFIIAQLKSASPSSIDLYHRHRTISSNFVYVKGDTTQIKNYELKKIINSRETVIKRIEYLIKWKKCGSEQNMWRNLSEMKNVMNMMKKYHRVMNVVVSNCYRRSQKASVKKSTTSSPPELFASIEIVLRKSMIVIFIIASTSIFSSKTFIQLRRFSWLLPSV